MPPAVMTCRRSVTSVSRIVAKGLAKMTSAQKRDAATQMTVLVELMMLNGIGHVRPTVAARLGAITVNVAKLSRAHIVKAQRLASVVRLRAVTAKGKRLERVPQTVAGKSDNPATQRHRAHRDTSAVQ
jgi:hypothetical protein